MIRSVLFVSGFSGGTRRYRCEHHREQLALLNIDSTIRDHDDPLLLFDALEASVVILHRVPCSPLIGDLLNIARLVSVPVIFETDDLTFDPTILNQVRILDSLDSQGVKQFEEMVRGQAEVLSRCNFMITTTESLAEAGTKLGKQSYVHRNACSEELLHQSELAFAQAQVRSQGVSESDQVTLGYFSGTPSHDHDFSSIAPALIKILNRYPMARMLLVGPLRLDRSFDSFRGRIEQVSFLPWQELPQQIARVDINLAPLEPGNIFCDAKSELKYFEAALLGAPTIASPTQAFRLAIHHGDNGLLAETLSDWEQSLARLIEQPDLRRQIGHNARQCVLAEYTPQKRSVELVTTLLKIRSEYDRTRDSPPSLNEALSIVGKHVHDHLIVVCRKQQTNLLSIRYLIPRVGHVIIRRLREFTAALVFKATRW